MNSPALLFCFVILTAACAPAVTRTWDGGAGTAVFSGAANWSPDGVPANGDDLVFPVATPNTVTNDLTGRTFGSLRFTAGTTLAGNAFALTGGIIHSGGGVVRGLVTINANLTLGASQTFAGTSTGNLTFGGNVAFGASVLTVSGASTITFQGITGSSTTGSKLVKFSNLFVAVEVQANQALLDTVGNAVLLVDGDVARTGTASLRKKGTGRCRFRDSASIKVPIEISEGVVEVVSDAGLALPATLNGGALRGGNGGHCTALNSLAGGGRFGAFDGGDGDTGIFTTGSLSLNAATTLETQVLNFNAGTGYDQISVVGGVNLGGAALDLQLLSGFNVNIGQSIFPLLNDGTDAIVGTFAGLPEGAFIPVPVGNGGGGWTVSYTGGTGNDVALTRVVQPPPVELEPVVSTVTFGNPDANGNRTVTISGKGTPGASYRLENSVNLTAWTPEGTAQTANTTTGALSFSTTASPPVRVKQFWRFRKL